MSKAAGAIELRAEYDMSAVVAQFHAQLSQPDRPFGLLVRFCARAGTEASIAAAFAQARGHTLAEPGCGAFDLSRTNSDAARFVIYERWWNLAAFEKHLHQPYTAALRHTFESLMTGMPEIEVLLPADGQ